MATDLESIWLKINYFFLTNRDDLKKWWVILLIAADVFIVVFVFTNSILFILGIPKQTNYIVAMAQSPIDYTAIRESSRPKSLEIVNTAALPNANSNYDLIAQINNPNKDWVVESIKYNFVINGQPTDSLTDFIMPNSDKYLTMLSVPLTSEQNSIALTMEIKEINWSRVPDINKLVSFDFSFENINYSSYIANKLTIHNVEAEVINNGFKGFWQTRFIVILYSGDKIAGVNYVYYDEFKAGAKQSLKSQWNYLSLPVTSVVILPDMDLTDLDNII